MRLELEYWSDPLCIWAYATEDRLDSVLAQTACVDVRWRVVPVFGSIPSRFRGSWADKGVAGRVAATRQVAERFGHDEVSGRCWENDCPASSWSSGAAVHAAQLAERAGNLELGSGTMFFREVRRAFFVDELNVARRDVQLQLAEKLGMARAPLEGHLDDGTAMAALWEDYERKEALRIQGSPTYVFDGGRAMLYGAFSEGMLEATVRELLGGGELGASNC